MKVYEIIYAILALFGIFRWQSKTPIKAPIDIASLHWPDGIWEVAAYRSCRDSSRGDATNV